MKIAATQHFAMFWLNGRLESLKSTEIEMQVWTRLLPQNLMVLLITRAENLFTSY